jgi:hypothetical protein
MMKRLLGILGALAAIPLALAAQEAGLAISANATAQRLDQAGFSAYGMATPSFTLPLGSKAELSGSAYAKGYYSSAGGYASPLGLTKLDLKITLKKPTEELDGIVFDLGRLPFADPSGYILGTPADGFALAFKYPSFEFAFRSGYTGLVSRSDANILLSLADEANAAGSSHYFASPRLVTQAGISLPSLFGQAFALSFINQDDLNDRAGLLKEGDLAFDPSRGGRISTQYFELQGEGAIKTVSYSAFFAYGLGKTLYWNADSYATADISSFILGAKAIVPVDIPFLDEANAVGYFLVASGDKNATGPTEGASASVYKAFNPITQATLSNVFTPKLSNLVLVGASLEAAPSLLGYKLPSQVKLMSFFRPTAGPVSASGIDSTSTSAYLGTGLDLNASCRFFPDLELSLASGVFVPGSAFASGRGLLYSLSATATLSL